MHPEVLAPETTACLELLKKQPFIPSFYLGGGTAVALILGHRQSVDLDFFSQKSFNTLQLQQQLTLCGSFILEEESSGTLHGVLNEVKLSFLEYRYPLLRSHLTYKDLALASLEDLCCMKLEAIAARGKKRDFLDVYTMAQSGLSLRQMLSWFEKKYISVNYNKLHLLKSLTYFADAEGDPAPILLKPVDWSEVKKFFQQEAPHLLRRPYSTTHLASANGLRLRQTRQKSST